MYILYIILAIIIYTRITHILSYRIIKSRILKRRKWDLNICCGKTNGGGINADIFKHKDVANFVFVENIYHLPFADKQFDTCLCSHTMEHVDNPAGFFEELKRVSNEVTIVVPPLWDISGALYLVQHKWFFLSFKKEHTKLPKYIRVPFSMVYHKHFGQINKP